MMEDKPVEDGNYADQWKSMQQENTPGSFFPGDAGELFPGRIKIKENSGQDGSDESCPYKPFAYKPREQMLTYVPDRHI